MLAGVHACRRGNVAPGKAVAVLGAGPIGALRLAPAPLFYRVCMLARRLACRDAPFLAALVCRLLAANSMWASSTFDQSSGHAGLVALMCAKAFGADAVAITDIKPDNLELATQLGADVAMHLDAATDPAQVPAGPAVTLRTCHPTPCPAH